jgi:outer membrane protein
VFSDCRRLLGDWLRREPLRAVAGCAVFACVGLGGPAVRAQAPPEPPLSISLAEALQWAARASDERAQARYGVASAEAQQTIASSGYYPQVSVSASYERTLASEFEDVFDAPPVADAADSTTLAFEELPFGRKNVYRAGASVAENLFAGGATRAGVRAARAARRQADIGLATADAQTTLATVEAYYDALLSDRFLAISSQSLQRAQATLEQVQLSRREGQESEYDLLRARVALENERPGVVSRQMQQRLAYLRLRQRLGVPPERQLVLTSKLEDHAPLPGGSSSTPSAGAVATPADDARRAPVRQAELAVSASEANIAAARSAYYPSLSLQMSYGRVNYPDGVLPTLSDWRTNWTVGAYLSWSLFEGFRTRGQVLAAQAELGQARTRLSQTQKLAHYDTQTALEQLAAAEAVYQASAGVVEQANRAYSIAELRYREGISTQLELSDARFSLAQAETNRAQATRDLEVARVRRALLPNLPLGTVTPADNAAAGAAISASAASAPVNSAASSNPGAGAGTGAAPAANLPASSAGAPSARGF